MQYASGTAAPARTTAADIIEAYDDQSSSSSSSSSSPTSSSSSSSVANIDHNENSDTSNNNNNNNNNSTTQSDRDDHGERAAAAAAERRRGRPSSSSTTRRQHNATGDDWHAMMSAASVDGNDANPRKNSPGLMTSIANRLHLLLAINIYFLRAISFSSRFAAVQHRAGRERVGVYRGLVLLCRQSAPKHQQFEQPAAACKSSFNAHHVKESTRSPSEISTATACTSDHFDHKRQQQVVNSEESLRSQ